MNQEIKWISRTNGGNVKLKWSTRKCRITLQKGLDKLDAGNTNIHGYF